VPWTAAYVDGRGEPACDVRSNIAAESRAKIIYEQLINITDDPSIKDALGFLMTREIAHQKSFEKALYAITDNFLRASCRASRLRRHVRRRQALIGGLLCAEVIIKHRV
jgi:Mn-containing catalase